MSDTRKGLLAAFLGCVMWGLFPILFRMMAHIPPVEVLAHRATWSFLFFMGLLALQRRLPAFRHALTHRATLVPLVCAMVMISSNWLVFIYATSSGQTTQVSLGYYIFPLAAVLVGRVWFSERLGLVQGVAVALAAAAVMTLALAQGALPWISLYLAMSFCLYGVVKKRLDLGPVLSVAAEVALFLPVALVILASTSLSGQGAFGASLQDSVLLVVGGVITAVPLILFSYAARRVPLGTLGILQYISPSMHFLCATLLFGEPFTTAHKIAFPMIWSALVVFSIATLRQDRVARRLAMVPPAVPTTVNTAPRA
ncbi:EamA family transporter RarD [Arenibacterium halophilum]|uniref:EamA family transporter RarD n=1 Tax=Arenibacterium halophilum TaxID=2583821 RepID=A0ABY2XA55_9RHOB|nr:EamA family transporter RarD [Arenibacterium halophilum]TMV13260.1 EamA family transporter RarD [Arenibacterium halophilum]